MLLFIVSAALFPEKIILKNVFTIMVALVICWCFYLLAIPFAKNVFISLGFVEYVQKSPVVQVLQLEKVWRVINIDVIYLLLFSLVQLFLAGTLIAYIVIHR